MIEHRIARALNHFLCTLLLFLDAALAVRLIHRRTPAISSQQSEMSEFEIAVFRLVRSAVGPEGVVGVVGKYLEE
jgi:hypothetical protein